MNRENLSSLLRLLLAQIVTIIIALDSLQDIFHLLCLLLPLLLAHLGLALEKLRVGFAVASAHAVP